MNHERLAEAFRVLSGVQAVELKRKYVFLLLELGNRCQCLSYYAHTITAQQWPQKATDVFTQHGPNAAVHTTR